MPRELRAPLAAGAGAILAAVGSRFAEAGGFSLPCRWLEWTGIPCPGCGATRCLAACGRLNFLEALHWNPLVACAAIAFLAWPVQRACGIALLVPGTRFIVTAIAFNWLYLCWALPR